MEIYEFYNKHLNIHLTSNADLPFAVTERKFKKGDVITRYGQVEKMVYFILEGIIEQTVLGIDGKEMIIDFFEPGGFVCSYTSFLTQQPSDVQMTALTNCKLQVITHTDLKTAYKTSLIVNQIGRMVTEYNYIIKANREKGFLHKSAEERYRELLQQKPNVVATLPVKKIALYLGIHPESLSRIRSKVIF